MARGEEAAGRDDEEIEDAISFASSPGMSIDGLVRYWRKVNVS